MRRIILLLIAIAISACQDETINFAHAIEGSWYGSVGKNPMTGDNQYIRLDLMTGKADVSTYFTKYDRGWHDATGVYTIDTDNTIHFDIDMGECEINDESRIAITHAIVKDSYTTGEKRTILQLNFETHSHYTEEVTSSFIWLSRERPDM